MPTVEGICKEAGYSGHGDKVRILYDEEPYNVQEIKPNVAARMPEPRCDAPWFLPNNCSDPKIHADGLGERITMVSPPDLMSLDNKEAEGYDRSQETILQLAEDEDTIVELYQCVLPPDE